MSLGSLTRQMVVGLEKIATVTIAVFHDYEFVSFIVLVRCSHVISHTHHSTSLIFSQKQVAGEGGQAPKDSHSCPEV